MNNLKSNKLKISKIRCGKVLERFSFSPQTIRKRGRQACLNVLFSVSFATPAAGGRRCAKPQERLRKSQREGAESGHSLPYDPSSSRWKDLCVCGDLIGEVAVTGAPTLPTDTSEAHHFSCPPLHVPDWSTDHAHRYLRGIWSLPSTTGSRG